MGFFICCLPTYQFVWDAQAQQSFDTLKHALTYVSLIITPNFEKEYILYIFVSPFVVASVLV